MNKLVFLFIPLILSSVTHFVNPVGFPDIFFDEGIYMRRAINLIDTGNPQEGYFYDHPYFGQIVLASLLSATNFSEINPSPEPNSLKTFYLIPRIFMGFLAVLDTFLIYQIVRVRYGQESAFLSASLFAVLPFTWVFNRILLDSILVPLVLGSILLALYSSKVDHRTILIISSGILLGLGVFTKVPAFTIIFVVTWLVFRERKKIKDILFLILPVLIIPLIWPLNSILLDEFDLWQKDIFWQSQRTSNFLDIFGFFSVIDPLMFILGLSGIVIAAIRRDKFILFWFFPFIVFMSLIGYKQYFHLMIIIPVLCIAAGNLLEHIRKLKIPKNKIIFPCVAAIILVFGFTSTLFIVTNDISDNQFQVLSYIITNYNDDTTVLANPVYTWILVDKFNWENVPNDYSEVLFYPTSIQNTVIIVDPHYRVDLNRGPELKKFLDQSTIVKNFEGNLKDFDFNVFPYTSMQANSDAFNIEVHEGMGGS